MIEITAKEFVEKTGVGEYIPVGSPYNILLPNPKTIHEKIYGTFNEKSVSFPKTFVLKIPDAMVAGEIGMAIYKDYLIVDTAIRKEFLPPMEIIDAGKNCTSISHLWARNNYFHWLISSMSRLYLLKETKIFNSEDLFIVNSINGYEIQGFLAAGLETVTPNYNKWWKCKNLTIPSPMSEDAITSPIGCKFLRKSLLPKYKSEIEKIAIARRNRGITNSTEVYGYLESIGYKVIYCEDYSFQDQIDMFNGAEYVISPHGAGLANTVFCKEGTKILEILSPLYLNACFRKIAAYSDLDYYFLLGEGEISLQEHMNSDITVDMKKLKQSLELMEG